MFRIDREQNRLTRLNQKKFSELQLSERNHLQEWLANQPDALGEDLLIIQKEFDKFEDTRERLDLLALDKFGNLVVIENKLDDSGRDLVWQALKYTAYVSNLSKNQIVEIYQDYLDKHYEGESAIARICEFLNVEDLVEVSLNPGNEQRIFFIAANFRKEVTSTILWLLSKGVSAQCFKVTPFEMGGELILDIQRIIPTPEAEDFMIGMSNKDNEEKAVHEGLKKRHKLRNEFWKIVLSRLKSEGILIYENVNASKEHWLSAGSGVRSCSYQIIFSKNEARVELYLQRSEAEENKFIYDQLCNNKDEIEGAFGSILDWRRMDDKKASRIVCSKKFDGYDRDQWPEMINWIVIHIKKLENSFKPYLLKCGKQLRDLEEIEA